MIANPLPPFPALPESGHPWSALRDRMSQMRRDDADWRGGRTPLHVYFAGDDVLTVAREAYGMFMTENALAPAAFPSLRRMEEDVVGIALSLLGGGAQAAGKLTSGGTESIILAVRACRSWFEQSGRLGPRSHLLLPQSAHPAYDKAAELMGLRVRRYEIDSSYRANADVLAAHLDADTMMTVASVPSLPFGTVDPVAEIAEVARTRNVWLHVDACIGGFFAPFARRLGVALAPFDLSVPGVRSISADLHKYGYAAKGASVILYAHAEDRERQAFEFDAWPKGRYRTETLAGTRSGGAVAAAWAVLHHLGMDGYLRLTRQVLDTRESLHAGIRAIPGLHLFGAQPLGLLSFGSDGPDILAIGDLMERRGWYVSRVGVPCGLQMTVTPAHAPVVEHYLGDLRECAAHATRHATQARERTVVTY